MKQKLVNLTEDVSFVDQVSNYNMKYWLSWPTILAWGSVGFLLIIGGFFPEFHPTPSLNNVSPLIIVWMGLLLFVGSVVVAASALNWKNVRGKWFLELTGLVMCLISWVSYLFAAIVANQALISGIFVALFIALAVKRMNMLRIYMRHTEVNVLAYRKLAND